MDISNWNINNPDPKKAREISDTLGISFLAAKILVSRGIDTPESAEEFLFCDDIFHNPFLLNDMDKAVERINKAKETNELCVVYGDYDCDGISASALLTNYLLSIGVNAKFYIPSRKSGFGLNNKALSVLKEKGASLIITVDNGINANEQIDFANSIGLDVIVTDHHVVPDVLPNAVACINPHRKDSTYPFENLAGVGVALKLVTALEMDEDGAQSAYNYCPLAGLGTVADIVELKGENRAIVKLALERINEHCDNGINALIDAAGISENEVSSSDIAFMLGPRINAAGRVGSPSEAADLLMCGDDEQTAMSLASKIDGYNQKRKLIEADIYNQALEKLNQNPQIAKERVIVLAGKDWDLGVIGIVCAKIVSKYKKPCLLIGYDDKEARGSARSVCGYNIIDAITACSDKLTKFGGHKMAAGFSLLPEDIPCFTEQILAHAKENYDIMPSLCLDIDCEAEIDELSVEEISELSCLEPYGEGNPHPVFAVKNLKLENVFPLSGGKHTKLILSKNGKTMEGLCFGKQTCDFPYSQGDTLDVVVVSDLSEFGGNIGVSNVIKDIKLSSVDKNKINYENALYEKFQRGENLNLEDKDSFVPTRDEIAKLYIYIRKARVVKNNPAYLSSILAPLSYFKIKVAIDILKTENLIEVKGEKGELLLYVKDPQKVNIENSLVLKQLKKLV